MRSIAQYAILWDMDGVLIDTGHFHFIAWMETFRERSIPFSQEQFRETFGMNNAGILEYMLGEKPSQELLLEISDQKESSFRNAVKGQVVLLPGVASWLKRLNEWGCKQAIASSAPLENIDALVDELEIRTYFDAIVSGFDLPGKPDPALFLKTAAQIGLSPNRCIVFEDAIAGVRGAKRAGMQCIAVTTTNLASDLVEADLVVDSLDQLREEALIQALNE
ncbi:MAG: HAD-IA family hydrolase [Anaerolineales bacterium]|nr:HAD-IA family hydrolase [Anaerolineales bacterium]